MLTALRRHLKRRLQPLFDTRLFRLRPAEPYPVTLVQRRIFVLPTRAGLMYCLTLLAMLLASINYSLNLGFALTFLLAGMGLTSTFHAFRNLLGLEVAAGHDQRAHQGELLRYELTLSERAQRDRIALRVRAGLVWQDIELPRGGVEQVRLERSAERRGLNPIGRVIIETVYPLGLVRAWSVLTPAHSILAYPAIDADAPPPQPVADDPRGTRHDSDREGSDDFFGLRPYRDSDSPRQVAWKAVARSDTLISKAFALNAGERLALQWQSLPSSMGTEARLSRLTRWVVDASAAGVEYTLHLPGTQIGPGSDALHRDRCLEALAMYQEVDA